MKNFCSALMCFVFGLFTTNFAQIAPKFTIEFKGQLTFQKVTAAGTWLVSTSESLSAYRQEDGAKLWEIPALANLQEAQVNELPGPGILMVKQKNNVQFIHPFTGDISFNSESQGISQLEYEQMLFQSNALLVAGKTDKDQQMLFMVDISSGNIKWKMEGKLGKIIKATEFNKDEMLLVTLFHIYRFNSSTGAVVWKEATSEAAESISGGGALGSALGAFAEQMAANVTFNLRYFENKEKDLFILGSEVERKQTTSDGKTVVTYTNNYSAFNRTTGKRLWKKPIEMKGKFGPVIFQNNQVVILPDDENRTNINAFDLTSGDGLWGKKGNGISLRGGIYDAFETPKGLLLISGKGNNTFLYFLDSQSGVLTFEKPVKVNGEVVKLIPAGEHFAFVTSDEMNILNTSLGTLMLERSIATKPNLTVVNQSTLVAADPKKGTLVKVDLTSATVSDLFAEGLKFEGKESPQHLEHTSEGYLLTSDQNMALINESGKVVYQSYFPAPRESGWKRALLYAQAVRAAYVSANAYYAAGVLKSSAPKVAEDDQVAGALVEGIGQVYQEMGAQAQDFAKRAIERANARAKATTQARDFVLILTDNGKTFALVKVNKTNGKVEETIELGNDKEPKYAVDEVSKLIFRVVSPNSIAGYSL